MILLVVDKDNKVMYLEDGSGVIINNPDVDFAVDENGTVIKLLNYEACTDMKITIDEDGEIDFYEE